jgi:hypothetical protein
LGLKGLVVVVVVARNILPPWSFGLSSVSSTIEWTDKLYGVASIKSLFFYKWLFEYKTTSQPSFSDARVWLLVALLKSAVLMF